MPELLSSERQTPNRVIALFAPPDTSRGPRRLEPALRL